MRVNNFNDPVSLSNGNLTTLGELGGSDLTPATSETLGGVKIGSGVNVTNDGTISVPGATPYTLPPATSETLGGVKIGSGVNVDENGTISVSEPTPYILPPATSETLGGVKVGSGLSIANGVLSASGGGSSETIQLDRGYAVVTGDWVNLYYVDTQYSASEVRTFTIPASIRPYVDIKFNNSPFGVPVAIETTNSHDWGVACATVDPSTGIVRIPANYGYMAVLSYYKG